MSYETDQLLHWFNNADIANVGDAGGLRGSVVAGSLWFGLHTGDPGAPGDQVTLEAAYTGYARVAVARSAAGFTVAGNNVANAAIVTFGACTALPKIVTHFSVGRAASGASETIFTRALAAPMSVAVGITPAFAIGVLSGSPYPSLTWQPGRNRPRRAWGGRAP